MPGLIILNLKEKYGLITATKSKETSILKIEMNCPQVLYLEFIWIIYKVFPTFVLFQ